MLEVDVEATLGAFRLRATLESSAGVTALFGRSGSGKSSLVNCIAGLVRPGRGRIRIHGVTVFDSSAGIDLPVHRRRIGYVFQEGRLLPHLTVQQNLLYGYRLVERSERYVEPDHVTELLGLAPLLARRPGALSGGEKQRVAIGRALLSSPRLLLMDEPLAAIDAAHKGEILGYIERLHADVAVPIVYVSHAIEEVVRLADRVCVMAGGGIVAQGPVRDVMGRTDLFPAARIFEGGSVIEARVAEHDAGDGLTRLDFAGGSLYAAGIDAPVGEQVRVRVRARDVSISLTRPEGISMLNVIDGRVADVADAGGAIADVRIDAGGVVIRSRVTWRSVRRLGLEPGRPVCALIKSIALDRQSTGVPMKVLVRGIGDVGSAVAWVLRQAGACVVLHDVDRPAHPRRGMAYTDCAFEGWATLEGLMAKRQARLEGVSRMLECGRAIPFTTAPLRDALDALAPDVLIDARMRKRAAPDDARGLAPLTIGLGPNFTAGEHADLVVETGWGEALGQVLDTGSTRPLEGEPSEVGGHRRDRFVYAACAGEFTTSHRIGARVEAGEVVARIGEQPVRAPIAGFLRGLTHSGVEVQAGTKVVEVDARTVADGVFGLGERPRRIACGILDALLRRGRSAPDA